MALVNVTIGGTFLVSEESNQYIKPSITIGGVDPDGDVDKQIKTSKQAVIKIIGVEKVLLKQIAELYRDVNFAVPDDEK